MLLDADVNRAAYIWFDALIDGQRGPNARALCGAGIAAPLHWRLHFSLAESIDHAHIT
jgi:hypothetical protein